MFLRAAGQFHSGTQSFNMTPIIDIVFLLIIFFLVICQFIEAENFPVAVPDGCEFSDSDAEPGAGLTTVTVIKTDNEKTDFAVGSEKITTSDYTDIAEKLARLIDVRLKDSAGERRVVTLRIDKDVCSKDFQHALAAVAASSATDVRLATLKDRRAASE